MSVFSWAIWFVIVIATGSDLYKEATSAAAGVKVPPSPNSPQFPFPPQPVQQCSRETGGGICPLKNTCCMLYQNVTSSVAVTSGCIPSLLGPFHGECCTSTTGEQPTGCGVGYSCSGHDPDIPTCTASPTISDPLVQTLPRYPLCQHTPQFDFRQIHGFTLPDRFGNPPAQMLYYTSHPDIELFPVDVEGAHHTFPPHNNIRMIWILIHGANRNADDYFCAASATLARQKRYPMDEVLLVVPSFAVPSDLSPPNNTNPAYDHVLQWEDIPEGAWRYGANAIWPRNARTGNSNISSLDVVDAMVDSFMKNKRQFPKLEHITVAGHSSGGQFVQRWTLLSPYAGNDPMDTSGISLRSIVANPSSYAYLIPERYNTTTQQWAQPDTAARGCPEYNTWEWGLELAPDTPPYVLHVLQGYPYPTLVERFAQRQVVYLAGSQDRCNVSSTALLSSTTPAAWCQSHGLETTCADELQGRERWERHHLYQQMLHRIPHFQTKYHKSVVVPGVGHDHSLMFSSPMGLQAIFGGIVGDKGARAPTTPI